MSWVDGVCYVVLVVGVPWAAFLLGRLHLHAKIAREFGKAGFVALPVTVLAAQACVTCLEPFDERRTQRQIAVAQCDRCLKEKRTIKPLEKTDGST